MTALTRIRIGSLKRTLIAANTTRNLAGWDRALRAALPFVVLAGWLGGMLTTAAAIPLGVIALMLFPTSVTGACSIYYALGTSTLRRSEAADPER